MYIEAFALHKKYGGKGIHYIGGYNTSTSNTLDKKDGGNVTTQEVGTYIYISFIIVVLQSLVSSLISIVRQRERKPKRQRRVSSC